MQIRRVPTFSRQDAQFYLAQMTPAEREALVEKIELTAAWTRRRVNVRAKRIVEKLLATSR